MTEHTERAVEARVPTLVDEGLSLISRREPLTVRPGASLRDCLTLIRKSGVGDSVVVTDEGGRLVGILTERDIFGQLVGTGVDLDQPVETYMNAQPHTLRPDGTVRDAIELMHTGRFRNIPIVDEAGILVGIVRQADVLNFLAEAFPEELLNLPPRPHVAAAKSEGA
jgi:CBS domain-containing protein